MKKTLDVKLAIKALRIANRNVGKDWPTVSLAVAVALEALGVKVRPKLPGQKGEPTR